MHEQPSEAVERPRRWHGRYASATAATLALLLLAAGCRRARSPADEPTGASAAATDELPAGVLAPSVIDSHVHLAYWPVAERLAAAGIAAVVDLGAPLEAIGGEAPVTVLWSGPMLTRPGGYPIGAWDPGGFGAGCADRACVEAAVTAAADRGARLIKLALTSDGLSPELAKVAVAAAHARGLPVAAHALDDAGAAAAAAAGCDLLAHTPVGPLTDATVAAWAKGAVVSSLAAFGGGPAAIDNLRRLRAAGATVLYGSDLGNSRVAGVDLEELEYLAQAGLEPGAIVDSMTSTPARYWKLAGLGVAQPGPGASFVILPRDPRLDPAAYAIPVAVYLRGARLP